MTTFSVVFPDDLLKEINDYRFNSRIDSKGEAIRELIRCGLGLKKNRSLKRKKEEGEK